MMKGKRLILVICALGYATSTMIKRTIEEFLKKENCDSDWEVEAVGMNQAQPYVKKASIIVSSLELNPKEYSVPIINGVALISGINKDVTLNEILDVMKTL